MIEIGTGAVTVGKTVDLLLRVDGSVTTEWQQHQIRHHTSRQCWVLVTRRYYVDVSRRTRLSS